MLPSLLAYLLSAISNVTDYSRELEINAQDCLDKGQNLHTSRLQHISPFDEEIVMQKSETLHVNLEKINTSI